MKIWGVSFTAGLLLVLGLLLSPMLRADIIYRASSNVSGSQDLQGYDTDTNTWSTLAALPTGNHTQLAADETFLYALLDDGDVHRYDPVADSWSMHLAGPGVSTSGPIGMLEVHNGEFFWAVDGSSTLYYTVSGVWNNIASPSPLSSAADVDRINGMLYIRTYSQLGHMAFDISGQGFGAGCPDPTVVGENSRTGVYYNGNFYSREETGTLQATNVNTCSKTDTGVALTTTHSSSAVSSQGVIYLNGYTATAGVLEGFDVAANGVTALAGPPAHPGNHFSLAAITRFSAPAATAVPSLGHLGYVMLGSLLLVFGVIGRRKKMSK